MAPETSAPAVIRVAVRLSGPHARPVRRHLETLPGVEVVEPDVAPPQAVVGDLSAWSGHPAGPQEPPGLLLVDGREDPVAVARAVSDRVPDDVVAWPAGRHELADRLRSVAGRAAGAARRDGGTAGMLVAGAAGGVGTTTVALALGGLAAWHGRPTLVIARGPVPVPDARRVDRSALTSPGLWAAATRVPGVGGLRVVGLHDHLSDPPTDADLALEPGDAELVIVEPDHDRDADVLVARRDAAGLAGIAASSAAVVVLRDDGPAGDRAVSRVVADRWVIGVPYSTRVARAGLHGRVPGGLPGRFVRLLAPVIGRRVPGAPRSRPRPGVAPGA